MCVAVPVRGRKNTPAGEEKGKRKKNIPGYLPKELMHWGICEGVKTLRRYRSYGNYKCY